MAETPTQAAAPVPRPIRPKYQVFVSSTFGDLEEERKAVTWEILKLGQIPTGMENFSAASERGWKVIEKTIGRSDYYILVLAGRYGSSFDETGVSWTEHEYDYAIEQRIPVIAFIRMDASITANKMDTGKSAKRIQEFKAKVKGLHLVEWWSGIDDLRSKVASALPKRIQEDEDEGTPRPGWYRGGQGPSPAVMEELARLSSENRALREDNERLKALTTAAKDEATFAIDILDARGTALSEVTFARVLRQSPESAAGAYTDLDFVVPGGSLIPPEERAAHDRAIGKYLSDKEKLDAVLEYTLARALKACTQITFAIRSLSGPTNTDVRCEIRFPDGFKLYSGPVFEAALPSDLPRRPRQSPLDMMGHFTRDAAAYGRFAVTRVKSMTATKDVSVKGEVVSLWLKKAQHSSTNRIDGKQDIVTVLPPYLPYLERNEGELSYCIWSDQSKRQEGKIPFRIVNWSTDTQASAVSVTTEEL